MTQIEQIERKIVCRKDLKELILKWRDANERIVFTNGCFDLLHLGHVDYLAKAKDLAKLTATKSAPIRPGPLVTQIASIWSRPTSATESAS